MARPKGDATANAARRQDILRAGFEVFSRAGFKGGSLAQIAEIVGMTEAGILHHFKTKANLLTAVLGYRDDITLERFDITNSDGIKFVRSWLDLIDYNVSIPGMVELFCVMSAESTSEEHPAHEYFKERYAITISTAKASMIDLQNNGYIGKDAVPEDLGRALIALSDGLQVQWLLDRKWDMIEEHKSFFRRILTAEGAKLCGL